MLLFAGMFNAHEKNGNNLSHDNFYFCSFFGILTIRSVISEVKQKDHLEQITKELDRANKNLTDLNIHLEERVRQQTADVSKGLRSRKESEDRIRRFKQS